MLGKTEGRRRRGQQRMRWLDGITSEFGWHKFKQAPGDGDGQGRLGCCNPWDRKESDTTEQFNNNNKHISTVQFDSFNISSVAQSPPISSSCRPLLLLPSIFPSIRVFSNESVRRIRWPKDWSFSFNISPSNEYSGLISFRIDWFDLLAVQGTLESLLQHHNSKTSVLQCSAFFMVQLSHLYMTTGKIIAVTKWTFVGKVIALLFNMLSR